MTIPTTHSQTPRWWLVSVLAAVAAMALATGALYLPSGWWWVLVLGLVVFGITFWLQPSSWYRRRAAIAMSIAAITTIAPGFEAILRFGPDTMGSLIVKTGWPAIVMPWLVAAWFGWLDFLSRKPVSQVTGASMQTSIRAIFAKTVHVTIHQGTTQLEPNNEYPDNADPPEIPRVAATLAPAFSKGGNHPIAQSRLPHSAEQLIGRTQELRKLTQALNSDKTHIVSIIAWGGVGKTSLVHEWMSRLAVQKWPKIERYFDWSFYSQGVREQGAASADNFIAEALRHFGDADPQAGSPHDRGERLARLVTAKPTVLILDGLEPLQYPPGPTQGEFKDPALWALLRGLAPRPFIPRP